MTTTTDGTTTYSYDNTNQVTGATYTTNPGATQPANESYSFDSNGNRTNTGYSTGTNNQLLSDGIFNYGYDQEGNRTSQTRISNDPADDYLTTFTWDYRNRLSYVQFYNNSGVLTKHVHNIYDVFDQLLGKQVDDTGSGTYNRAEFYVLDGNDVALQFDAAGDLTHRYLSGPSASGVDTVLAEEDVTSLTSPGAVTWPLTDNLGTVRDIVDSTGAVIDHLVYNSFGQVAHETAPTVHHLKGYTGSYYDPDTGMVNDWHRWYDPAVGRWISEDPIGFAASDANLSRYVVNAATIFNDPQGLHPVNPHWHPDLGPAPAPATKPAPRPRGRGITPWDAIKGIYGHACDMFSSSSDTGISLWEAINGISDHLIQIPIDINQTASQAQEQAWNSYCNATNAVDRGAALIALGEAKAGQYFVFWAWQFPDQAFMRFCFKP